VCRVRAGFLVGVAAFLGASCRPCLQICALILQSSSEIPYPPPCTNYNILYPASLLANTRHGSVHLPTNYLPGTSLVPSTTSRSCSPPSNCDSGKSSYMKVCASTQKRFLMLETIFTKSSKFLSRTRSSRNDRALSHTLSMCIIHVCANHSK
jgi:hypothetical protein